VTLFLCAAMSVASEQPAAQPKSAGEKPAKAATLTPDAEPEPTSAAPDAEPEPTSAVPDAEPEPTSAVPDAEPEPASAVPDAEPEPASPVPDSDCEPANPVPELAASQGQQEAAARRRWQSLDVSVLLGAAMSRRSVSGGHDQHLTTGLRLGAHRLYGLPLRVEVTATTDSLGRGESVAGVGISPWQIETLVLAGLDYTLTDRGELDMRVEALAGAGLNSYRIRYAVEEEGSASWTVQPRLAARAGVVMRYQRFRLGASLVGTLPLDPVARLWLGAGYVF
jgi:hypothetical protein